MLLLASPTKSIQAKTSILPVTPLDYVAVYRSVSDGTKTVYLEENGTLTNTYLDVIPSPNEGETKELFNFTLNNRDSQNQTIEISIRDSTIVDPNNDLAVVNKVILKAYLKPNWSLIWEPSRGWTVYDQEGLPAVTSSSVTVDWGGIGGDIANQTDLITKFDTYVLNNPAIVGATHTKITYDAKGLVTAGSDINTNDVPEATNLYFTEARVRSTPLVGYISGAGVISAADTVLSAIQKLNGNVSALVTGVSSVFGRTGVVVAVSGDYTTDLVTEGTNLYYTTARWDTRLATKTTNDLTEGTNLYYTDARWDTRLASKTTDSLTEGSTNKYFTTARVLATTLTGYVSGAGTVSSSDSILSAIQKLNGNISLVTGAVVYKGLWNANTNTPTLVSGVGTTGYMYKVSVAGTTTIDGISQWNVGDQILFDGTTWDKLDGVANEVISVNGLVGAVALTGTTNRITVSGANVFDIAATYVGQTSITTLGTITTGVWNGTAIGYAYLASMTSAQLAGIISDETGSGVLVFGTSPTFTTSVTLNGNQLIQSAVTASAGSAYGLCVSNTLTASANSDELNSVLLNQAFSNGAYTGVINNAVKITTGNFNYATASGIFTLQPATASNNSILNLRDKTNYNTNNTRNMMFIGTQPTNKDLNKYSSFVFRYTTGTASADDAALTISAAKWTGSYPTLNYDTSPNTVTDYVTILSNGRVGIGNTAPGVDGLAIGTDAVANKILQIYSGTTNASLSIQANGTNGGLLANGNQNLFISSAGGSGYITFVTNGVEYGRFTPQGNLQLGVTANQGIPLMVLKTTEQFRVAYDTSNYLSTTVTSAGVIGFVATGSTNPGFNFGNASANPNALGLVRIGQGTGIVDIGQRATAEGTIWLQQSSPTTTNYFATGDGSNTYINGPSNSLVVRIAGIDRLTTTGVKSSGSVSTFSFAVTSNTNQSTTVVVPQVVYTMGNTQWAAGNITGTQGFYSITQPTISFATSSSTATLTATVAIDGAPNSGTNAVQTTAVGLLVKAGTVNGTGTVGTSYGAYFNAQVGATTNYSAGFAGPNTLITFEEFTASAARINSSANLYFNAGSAANVVLQVAGTQKAIFGVSSIAFNVAGSSSGSTSAYTFNFANTTGQTNAAEVNTVNISTFTRQWATGGGTLALQRDFYIRGVTYQSITSPMAITDACSLYVEAPIVSSNITLTNPYAAGFAGNLLSTGSLFNFTAGATVTIGTTDSNSLQFKTSNSVRAFFQPTGQGFNIGSTIVSGAAPSLGINISAKTNTAWTAGTGIVQAACTYTDSTSSGTVATLYGDYFGTKTFATSNTTTYTNVFGTWMAGPVAGTNVTISNLYTLGIQGGVYITNGNITLVDGVNIAPQTTTGTKICISTTQKLAFWNATPIVQPANTTAIDTLLVNVGLIASGGTPSFSVAPTVGGVPLATIDDTDMAVQAFHIYLTSR